MLAMVLRLKDIDYSKVSTITAIKHMVKECRKSNLSQLETKVVVKHILSLNY